VTDQPPIESYGLLGDTRTAALVSEQGSVDWLCVPRFDGSPVFGRLIDPANGGSWLLRPARSRVRDRSYEPDAASLRTRWEAPRGEFVVHEGMLGDATTVLLPRSTLVRRVTCVRGGGEVEMLFDPRLGLPGRPPAVVSRRGEAIVCAWGRDAVGLTADRALGVQPGMPRSIPIRDGESITLALSIASREPLVFMEPARAYRLLEQTDRWWTRWAERFPYEEAHRGAVVRSLITLRLLTYAPSGAPVAAATTSLPAPIGGSQNWDYRFAWPRDASIGVGAFLALGSEEEPRAFLEWLVNASRITRPRLEVLYDLDGRPVRYERELEGVGGYRASGPVRIGNGAARQHQLDVYGWVVEAGWRMHEAGHPLSRHRWHSVRAFADLLADRWSMPDNGIWEERATPRHYVHSKLMAWLGLDRAVRLAAHYPAGKRVHHWRLERDRCATEIMRRGFDEDNQTYVRAFDAAELDASVLSGALLDFEPEGSPRLSSTITAVRRELGAGGALLYRYGGQAEAEGAFLPCSFWLVQALARAGQVDEAEEAFDQLCGMASPLGLYGEQIDPATGAHIGNFPQAFTHATFLQAVVALSAARGRRRGSVRTEHEQPA
jgi:GH15 family glucan-1,4-alpha-glucosidase